MQKNFVSKIITVCLIGLLFFVAIYMLKPIMISIILGLLLAYILHPFYKKIYKRVKKKNLAAIILILGLSIVIVIPLAYIMPIMIKQTFETYLFLQKLDLAEILKKILPSALTLEISNELVANLNNIISKLFSSLLNEFIKFVVNLPSFILQFAVFLFTFYFAVRDAEELKAYFSQLSPFSHKTEKKFMEEFREITNTIVYGQFLIGVIQGLALGIGLFILQVPKSLILTFVAIVVSIIPILGSWLVWLPAGIFLITTGSVFKGIVLLIYGGLFVSSIDNILRPYFISKKSHMSIVIALIGVIGGLYAFGIVGLVIGPLILSYVMIIIDFYRQGKLNELFRE